MWSLLQPTVHGANQPSIHLQLVQDIATKSVDFQNQVSWSVRKDEQIECCVATAGCVRACLQSGPQKSTSRYIFMYNCVQNSCCMIVWVPVLWNEGQNNTFSYGSHF
jgi:hypothetical protein